MSSLSPNPHMHSGSRGSSGFRRTYILLLIPILFDSSLNMTLNLFSRTFHVNCCIRYRFRPSWFTWEMVIRLKPHAFYIHKSPHLTVLYDTLHNVMLLNLLVRSFNFCLVLPFTWINKTRSSRGVVYSYPPPLPNYAACFLLFLFFVNLFKNIWIVLLFILVNCWIL